MMLQSLRDRAFHPLAVALVVFLLAAVTAASLIRRLERDDLREERVRVSNLAGDQAHALQGNIERALSATYALAALVHQGHGTVRDFETVAERLLPLYPGAHSLELAPRGVVRIIVPLAGNEQGIGHDLLHDPARTKAAFDARDTGKLTLDGPFKLLQGGIGAVGLLPVFLDDHEGKPYFWGFTSVVIRFPEALRALGLHELAKLDLAYELWRIDSASGRRQIIAASSSTALIEPAERALQVPNATWTLSVAPIEGWRENPLERALEVTLGLLFSLLLAYLAKLLVELRAHEQRLEALVAQRTAEVRAREIDLNRAQSIARLGSWVRDFKGNGSGWSAETCRILGVSADAPLSYEVFLDRVHPKDRDAVDRAWKAALKGGRYDIEHRIVVGAAILWVHVQADWEFAADGTQRRCVGTVQDITKRKRTEQALSDGAAQLRLFTDNVPAMTVSYDENLRCRFVNKRFAEFFGLTFENTLGKHLREVVGEEAYREIEGHYAQVLRGHPITYHQIHKLQNGESCHLEVKLLPHIGDNAKVLGCFSVTTDITEYKQTEERIQRAAHHDSLTGLPNRLLFNDRLNQAINLARRDSRQLALLYLDLDRFKPINDTLGHTAGDELLKRVAERIRREVRESDTVARVGGDEFTVILPNIARREEAETVAKKINAAFAKPFYLDSQNQSVEIGTSIGIAVYPADALDADSLIKAADAAMYGAKRAGIFTDAKAVMTALPTGGSR